MSTITLTRKRISVGADIDNDDILAFVHISSAVDNTERIIATKLPLSFSDEDRKAFYSAAIESNNQHKSLLSEWWRTSQKKYNLPDGARFDSSVPEFYEVVDENGVVYTGELESTPTEEGASLTYDLSGTIGKIVGDCDGTTCCNCKK